MIMTIVLEGTGEVREVPESLRSEGSSYGNSFPYARQALEAISQRLGLGSIYTYMVDTLDMREELYDEFGEPSGEVEEERIHRVYLLRAPYHSAERALEHFSRLVHHLESEPDVARHEINGLRRGDFRGTLWDLKVLIEVLRSAAAERRGFHLTIE